MSFLNIAKIVLELLPLLIMAIKTIEDAIPGQGQGELKLMMVKDVLSVSYNAGKGLVTTFEELWPVLKSVVETLVRGFNAVGVFKK